MDCVTLLVEQETTVVDIGHLNSIVGSNRDAMTCLPGQRMQVVS